MFCLNSGRTDQPREPKCAEGTVLYTFKSLPRASELRRLLLTTASLAELADLLAAWKEPAAAEADLTLRQPKPSRGEGMGKRSVYSLS